MTNNTNNTEKKLTGYPSKDKPWLKYYSEEAINAPLPECTVYENIFKHNKDYLNQTALEYFGTKISYKKLFKQVDDCAETLVSNSISKGSIITICSSGIPEVVYLVLACSKIGAIANFVNPLFETQQKIDRINDTNANTLFVLDKMYSYVKDVIDRTCIKKVVIIPATNSLPLMVRTLAGLKDKKDNDIKTVLKDVKYVLWNDYIKTKVNSKSTYKAHYEKELPMIMVYSSGTTGASKGIVLTQDGINSTILQYEIGLCSIKRADRFLQSIPFWFSTGIVISLLMPLCLGTTCIIEPVFSPESFLRDIIKYKPNYALVATVLWIYAAEHIDKDFDLSFLKFPITGGEQVLASTEKFINDCFQKHNCNVKLQKGWGMCELGATAATTVFHEKNKPESVGTPMPHAVISSFDVDNGEELKYNKRGEIYVQTPCNMKEYYKNPDATAKFFYTDKAGNVWGRTGDIGYVDEDGFVFILGRANDFFISPDGERHYLFDTENIILQKHSVDLCKVVTVESKKFGRDISVAHLILKKD